MLIDAYSTLSRSNERTPFDIQLGNSEIRSTGITLQISVTSPTIINSIYLSYMIYETLSATLSQQAGVYYFDSYSHNTLMFAPTGDKMPRSYAQIFGVTGFIIRHQ